MKYLYYFENASLALRSVDYLCGKSQMLKPIVTAIAQMDGWLVQVKMYSNLNEEQDGDFRAYLNELGIPEELSRRIKMVFSSLEAGQSPLDIMRRYQVSVVFHGSFQLQEIQALQQLLLANW